MRETNGTDQIQGYISDVPSMTVRSMHAWNELLVISTDMAFDVVLKNWDYSRSLRNSADQAVEDAIKAQHRYTHEMMEVWRGYTDNVQEIVTKTTDQK